MILPVEFCQLKFRQLLVLLRRIPLTWIAILASVLSSLYLIQDYGLVNESFAELVFAHQDLQAGNPTTFEVLSLARQSLLKLTQFFSALTSLSLESTARILMIGCHALIALFLVRIAEVLALSRTTIFALLFLLLSHPHYNNLRSFIISETIYWTLWLAAILMLIRYYKERVVSVALAWTGLFLLAGFFNLSAWLWLAFFPLGLLLWKRWRTRPVLYALLGYALFVSLALSLPLINHTSLWRILYQAGLDSYDKLQMVLTQNRFTWMTEDSPLWIGLYFLSGNFSLVLAKLLLSLGFVNALLLGYAIKKRQLQVLGEGKLRFLYYVVLFDVLCAALVFVLRIDERSLDDFSVIFLLLIISALGLSQMLKKARSGRYQHITVLLFTWCAVAYVASGFINFGPQKTYIKQAGQYALQQRWTHLYSENKLFLYYADKNNDAALPYQDLDTRYVTDQQGVYFGYELNRKRTLPSQLVRWPIEQIFYNNRRDQFIIFKVPSAFLSRHAPWRRPNSSTTVSETFSR